MKRILALFLCFALCLTLLPAASAEDIEIVDEPEEAVVPGGPLDDIALVDEPEAAPPFDDVEGDLDNIFGTLDNGLEWSIINFTLMIYGSGEIPDFLACEAPWYEYLERIHTLEVGPNIRKIGKCAFYGLTNLENLREGLPWYVESIGDYAFFSCSSLKDIMIDAAVTSVGTQAFNYCSSLRRLSFCGAPSVGSLAFGNCGSLEMLSFVGGAPSFSSNSFSGTTAAAWFPPDNSSWTASVRQNYGGSITWQTGYRGWAGDDIEWTFEGNHLSLTGTGWTDAHNRVGYRHLNDRITSASVGEGIEGLSWTFDRLTSLRTVCLPDSLTKISDCAFQGCTALESLTIPASVESLGLYTFTGDTSLRVIRFRGRMPELKGSGATSPRFEGVTATVYYPPIPGWSSSALQDQGGTLTLVCDDKVGDNVTWSLNDSGLLTLTGSGATWDYPSEYPGFFYVQDLCTDLSMDNRITKIGKYLFYRMQKLTSIDLPTSLTTIEQTAFGGASALRTVRFRSHAPTIEDDAFLGVSATVYYPPVPDWTSVKRQQYDGTLTWVCDDKVGDSVSWWLGSDGVLNLTGSGATWDYPSEYPTFYYFRSECKEIDIGPGISSIGSFLFYYMTSAKKLTLPKGMESIGSSAFRGCSALTDIVFKGHAPTIAAASFGDVTATVTYYPVYSWNSDTKQNYGGTLSWVCDDKIGASTTWELYGNGTLWIGGSGATDDFPRAYPAFYYFREECKSVVIGSSVTKLGTYLLYGMDSTTDVTANEGLATISDYAFENMSALKWIRFKGNAPTFASNCFLGVTATAYYHSGKSGWTSSVMQNYDGHITWVDMDAGYVVTIVGYTGDNASCSLSDGGSYSGETEFTVLSTYDKAVLVVSYDGSSYTVLPATQNGKRHEYTVNVTTDLTIYLVFRGDANLDGTVDGKDGNMVSRYAVKKYKITDPLILLAVDVDKSGVVDGKDGNMISRSAVKKYTILW